MIFSYMICMLQGCGVPVIVLIVDGGRTVNIIAPVIIEVHVTLATALAIVRQDGPAYTVQNVRI